MPDVKLDLNQAKEEIRKASNDELGYILGRYCGPGNQLMRERKYQYEAAKILTQLVQRELGNRAVDAMLTDTLLSDD